MAAVSYHSGDRQGIVPDRPDHSAGSRGRKGSLRRRLVKHDGPVEHATALELTAGLDEILRSPRDEGPLKLIVRRLGESEREVLTEATLDLTEGLVGDTWRSRGSRRTPDQFADPKMQLTVMNARVAALVAVDEERRKLAGDQLYVDFDLSESNLPPGSWLAVGSAVIEVTDTPHLGCQKFRERFGEDALRFVNSEVGRKLRLRGVNTRVIRCGVLELGDTIRKLEPEPETPGDSKR